MIDQIFNIMVLNHRHPAGLEQGGNAGHGTMQVGYMRHDIVHIDITCFSLFLYFYSQLQIKNFIDRRNPAIIRHPGNVLDGFNP